MRIKRLEVCGFKSFADRARLSFGAGITGVVGPNGCGKSNIVDAMRWCMGEMSAKHLRGRGMQDVIFGGSSGRGPLGMAEVTLTFDNDDGNVPPSYASCAEIAVTRRLFRDGSSEYLINKTAVRLRDVTDLFLGTGVGTRAYSIIEQGRISFVVNSRPEERRSLIEEVAGITKFKARKAAAERRMQATEQNLLRVRDIVGELERQLATLRKQAKKAQTYRELRAEQRDMELHLAVLDLLRIGALERVSLGEQTRLTASMDVAQRDLVGEEAALEARRLELLERERHCQAQQVACAEQAASLAALERDLAHWHTQQAEARAHAAQAAADGDDAKHQLAAAATERAGLAAEAETLAAGASDTAAAVEAARLAVDELQRELQGVDQELDALRRATLGHVQGVARQRALAGQLGERHVALSGRRTREREARALLQADVAQLEGRAAELGAARATLEAEMAELRAAAATARAALPALLEEVDASRATLQTAQAQLGQRTARLASLREVAQRLEGYGDGVRALMAKGAAVPGLRGLVAHVLQAEPDYERAIEAALGERLQYVLVDDVAAARGAIAYLDAERAGRGGFLPQALPPRQEATRAPSTPGVIGPALAHVTLAPEHAALGAALLGDVLLVRDLDAACAAAAAAPLAWTYVTVAGELLGRDGAMLGGVARGGGLLASRREGRELAAAVAREETAVATLQGAHDELDTRRLQREVDLQQLGKDLHAAELAHMGLAKDHDATTGELRRLLQRTAAADQQLAAWEAELARLDADAAAAEGAARLAETGQQESEWRLAELQERRAHASAGLAEHSDTLTAAKVRIAESRARADAAAQALRRLDDGVAALTARQARASAAASEGDARASALAAQIEDGTARVQALEQATQAATAALTADRGHYEAEQAAVAAREQALRERRRGSEALHGELAACTMALQRLELERQGVVEAAARRHDVAIWDLVTDYHTRPPPSAAQRRRLAELERSIRALGPIHLTAIEECAEVEARFAFLGGQRDDLEAALGALREAINRINRASRERFLQAFDAVNEMFQKVYPRLFRGGEARLELTSRDDLLEAGVDIIAMPPGKKLQSVGLLSGGEKALTATALVFAIFLIKPSPFCILDEVDAPLDEANVGRFNGMLREISQLAQFIVITHNKQTMLQADRLFGITMEEPGMSKVVAVDLQAGAAAA